MKCKTLLGLLGMGCSMAWAQEHAVQLLLRMQAPFGADKTENASPILPRFKNRLTVSND